MSVWMVTTNLAMLSPAELIATGHLERQPRTNLDLGGKQLCAIPVVLDFLLNLLTDGQLLGFLLFLGNVLSILNGHSLGRRIGGGGLGDLRLRGSGLDSRS